MSFHERLLVFLLRLGGTLTSLAFFAIWLPRETMAATHEWLGMGAYPEAPLTDYLTRMSSGLYAVRGGLLFVLSTDVRRFAPLILYLGAANIAFGIIATGVGLHAPMPLWWALSEGPWIVAVGLALVWLARKVERPPAAPGAGRG